MLAAAVLAACLSAWPLLADDTPAAAGPAPEASEQPVGVAAEQPPAGAAEKQPQPPPPGVTLPVEPPPTAPGSEGQAGPEGQEPKPPPAPKKPSRFQLLLDKYDLLQGFNVSGSNTMTFQEYSIDGSESTFESQRWDTGNFVQRSSLHLEGPVWKELMFQADISDSGWGQSYNRWVGGFVGHDTAMLYGDLDLSLGGNEFVGFRKSTRGWQIDQKLPGKGFARGFYTREKGLVRNQTFVGNDTAGPYFLTYTPIIEGSEVVKVNEEFLEFGDDYRLDYDTGQLWFEPVNGQPRIITAADTVSVSYQSLGYNDEGPQELYGFRAEFPLLKDRLVVGLTTLQQDRVTAGSLEDTVGYQEDIYNGSGSTGPFDTNYRPIIADGTSVVYEGVRQIIDRPLIVLVDSVEQVEGTDFDSYRSIGRVIFRRAVPPTSLVIIRYYYDISSQSTALGDQNLWGIDLDYEVGKNTNLSLDWAKSGGQSAGQDGSALSSMLSYSASGGKLRLIGEYRSIDPGFTYIDTVGFRRREKGFNVGADWQINDHIAITNRYSNLDSDSGLSFGYSGYSGGYNFSGTYGANTAQSDTDTSLDVSTERNDFTLRLNYDGWPDVSYQRNAMANSGGSTADSEYNTDALQLSYSPSGGKYSIQSRLSRTKQRSTRESTETEGEMVTTGSDSDQLQVSASYTPSQTLSFSASYADNSSSAVETVNESNSSNVQLTARWNPSPKYGIDFSRSMSKSDGRVTSSYYSAYTYSAAWPTISYTALNPGGGGGDDDDDDDDTEERPSSEDTNDRISLFWRPSDKLSLDAGIGQRKYKSTGSQGYLADSIQDFWTLGANWQTSEALALTLALGYDNLDFLDEEQGAVENQSYVLSANYRPPGKDWSTGLTVNMQDGSSPTYVGSGRLQRYVMVPTELLDFNGHLSYTLNDDLSLNASAGLSDYKGGYADFRKNTAEISLRYRLSGTVGLDVGYRYIRHISRMDEQSLIYGTSGTGQNYIAGTFLLNLTTNFRGGLGSKGSRALGPGYGSQSGMGGGPGTFGGYSPSLFGSSGSYGSSGGSFGGSFGGSYGSSLGGISSGFGSSSRRSYQTGYGASQFDTLGTRTGGSGMAGLFGPSSPFSGGGMSSGGGSRGSKLDTGIGEFRKGETGSGGFDAAFGTPGAQSGPGGSPRPGAAGDREPQLLEDWWLLEDNMPYW